MPTSNATDSDAGQDYVIPCRLQAITRSAHTIGPRNMCNSIGEPLNSGIAMCFVLVGMADPLEIFNGWLAWERAAFVFVPRP